MRIAVYIYKTNYSLNPNSYEKKLTLIIKGKVDRTSKPEK
jgi:hypothetical protein